MPTWNEGKLLKKGSYCNWESVLAHAAQMHADDPAEFMWIKEYVITQVGHTSSLSIAPHYQTLEHFKGEDCDQSMNADEFHSTCCAIKEPVRAIKLLPPTSYPDKVVEIMMTPVDGKLDFEAELTKPSSVQPGTSPSMVQQFRSKPKDKEICVFYYPGKNGLTLNAHASHLLRMQIYGEVIISYMTKETSFKARERFIDFTLSDYEHTLLRKRKVVNECTEDCDYKTAKKQMETSLADYEKRASSLALIPGVIAKAQKLPPVDGRQLAALVKHERSEAE